MVKSKKAVAPEDKSNVKKPSSVNQALSSVSLYTFNESDEDVKDFIEKQILKKYD